MKNKYNKTLIILFEAQMSTHYLQYTELLLERKALGIRSVAVFNVDSGVFEGKEKIFDEWHELPEYNNASESAPLEFECLLGMDDIAKIVDEELSRVDHPSQVEVLSFGEYTLSLAAKVREKFNMKGPSLEDVTLFRDKVLMKDMIKDVVRVPKYTTIERALFKQNKESYFDQLKNKIGLPFIIKPTSEAGSFGVIKVEDFDSFLLLGDLLKNYNAQLEAEEFIEGTQYHCDIIYHKKQPIVAFCSEFNRSQLDLFRGKNVGTMPLLETHPLYNRFVEFCTDAANALNAENGVIHTELFHSTNDEIVFIETANRIPGGRTVHAYRSSFGVDIAELDLTTKVSDDSIQPSKVDDEYCFWILIPKREGKVSKLLNPELNSRYTIDWAVEEGEVIPNTTNFEEQAGRLIAYNRDYEALKQDFYKMADLTFIEFE